VLIDPQGIVRAITHPGALTAGLLKDLVAGRPLEIRQDPESMPVVSASAGKEIGLRDALYLVYLGPPDARFNPPMAGPTEAQSPRANVRDILRASYAKSLSGSPVHRIVFDEGVPDTEFSTQVKVPKGSSATPYDLLRTLVESIYGVRGVREQREMDILVLKHVGPKRPSEAAGDAKLGRRVSLGDTFTRGENEPIITLAGWLAERTGKPVVDETALDRTYDWQVAVKSNTLEALNAGLSSLGLSLAPDRRRIEVVMVRKVDPHGDAK
jgi:uncharacterized protein (TIGR03435 family)